MSTSPTPSAPVTGAASARPPAITTAEIKRRIAAMFADEPGEPDRSRAQRRQAVR
ncbi:hypothetical protein [Rhodococcus olei]|uniref:hypothetical protein n=1 Tax=Rhodococcus olei TaxID=2161675 RepID=UPI0031ECC08E